MTPGAFDLFTIGHSNHPIERFIELVRGAGVTAIADVLGGRPRDPRLYRDDGVADYAAMARTDDFRAGLDRVAEGTRRYRVCLMCAEREPLDCHRCLLVARALKTRGFAIGHLLVDGTIEPHAQTEERLLALAGKSSDL